MPSRIPAIDAARAFLLLLGLPYHMAGVVLYQMAQPRTDFSHSPTIVLFVTISHAFRMFAFFILSGYFSAMMVEKRGRNLWIEDRLFRLGLPLLAGLITVGVAQYWLMAHLLGKPAPALLGLPTTLGELWFLCTLILLCLTYFVLPSGAVHRAERAIEKIQSKQLALPAMLAVLALWGIVHAALRVIANQTQLPHDLLQVVLSYFAFLPAFAIGVLFWHSALRQRIYSLANGWIVALTALLLIPYLALDTMVRSLFGIAPGKSVLEKFASNSLEGPVALLCSLIVFALMARLFARKSRFVDLVVEGALAIYIVHIPFQQIIAWAMQDISLPPVVLWLGGSVLGFALSIGTFLVLRSHPFTAALFCGKRLHRPRPAPPLPTTSKTPANRPRAS